MNTDLIAYYKERAREYEHIYQKPERQEALTRATSLLQEMFANKKVGEIACGTGYWTHQIAETATHVYASDINQSVLDIAQHKPNARPNVSFTCNDLYQLSNRAEYDHLFAGFIWSHIPLQELDAFLAAITQLVPAGGMVVLMDNLFVPGSNLPITHTDSAGNTFQTRSLADGSTHLVRKNFPTEDWLRATISRIGAQFRFIDLTYYWMVVFQTKPLT